MSSPAYDGKGQPPITGGWFRGFVSWWGGLTPQYVTNSSSGKTLLSGNRSTTTTIDKPGALASAPAQPRDPSSESQAAASSPTSNPPSGASHA